MAFYPKILQKIHVSKLFKFMKNMFGIMVGDIKELRETGHHSESVSYMPKEALMTIGGISEAYQSVSDR